MWNEGILGALMCGFVTIVLIAIIRKRRGGDAKDRFPPGPFGWPIIGHLHLLPSLPHQVLRDLSTKYGDMLGLRLGQQLTVVVSSPKLAKEILTTHDRLLANRPPTDFSSIVLYGSKNDILFGPLDPEWRKRRKICTLSLFTAKRLRDLEYVRHAEMASLLQRIHEESLGGQAAVDIGRCVGSLSCNILMRLVQSKANFEAAGENMHELIKELEEEAGNPSIGDFIPGFSWLDFRRKRRLRRFHVRLDNVLTAILEERKGDTSTHDDLLHSLLSTEETLSRDELKSILNDILAAGIHTTSLTLEWVMAELLRNPRCLHQLQGEIYTVLGKKQQITDADIPKLSYLQCIVKENFRLHPVVPLLIPRISTEKCEVNGYTLPVNTQVLVNVWAIGRDERVWPNANQFQPERFEGKDINVTGQHFELTPFGSGRRICLGLPIAMSVVEVTLANLVNCFDWELPYGETHTSINMDEKSGVTAYKAIPLLAIPKPRLSF